MVSSIHQSYPCQNVPKSQTVTVNMITKVTAVVMRMIGASIHYRPNFILLLKARTGDASSGDAGPLIRLGVNYPIPRKEIIAITMTTAPTI